MLIAGIACISAILVTARGVPRFQAWEHGLVDEAREARSWRERLEADAATFAALKDSVGARDSMMRDAVSPLVRGRTPDGAAAAFASVLERIAENENVGLTTVTLNPDSVVRYGLTRVTVRLSGETDVNGLLNFLYAIESHRAPMTVRELVVSQPDPTAPSSRMETVRIDLAIQTLARVDSATKRLGT